MTTVVSNDPPRSSKLEGAQIPRFSPPKNQKNPTQTAQSKSNRPRTRSSVQQQSSNSSFSSRSTPRRRKSNKKSGSSSKEGSPVIDLTADEENQPQKRQNREQESPLPSSKRRRPSPRGRELTINTAPTELNSSPIRSSENRHETMQPMSSPVSKRKIVTFSDDVVPSSPTKPMETPRKSILKNSGNLMGDSSPLDPNNSAMWMKTAHSISHSFSTEFHSPNNPSFWQPGTIIQLEPRSNDLPQLVDGCMEVLKDVNFSRKFEVYATLNQVCKFNDATVLAELFLGGDAPWLQHTEKATRYKPRSNSDYIKEAISFVRRDILATEDALHGKEPQQVKLSPTRNNPFQSRVLNQALKFAAQLLMSPSVNRSIPISDVQWLYSHTCDQIVDPTISKSLVLPYLSIIKDCHFAPKRRRAIFENPSNPVSEKMLSALLNIRNFGSSSLVNEKFIALKNMISNFPNLMAKNFHLWFVSLVLNLCDTMFPLYTKVVSSGITALLEAARNFLDNTDICFAGRQFLESPLPQSQSSFTSNNLISISTTPSTLTIDYVIESLIELIQNGHHKFAMDIWVGMTLLCGKFENGIENWRYLTKWLQVHKTCFNESDMNAKIIAISSWKVIVYKICCVELREVRSHSFSEKSLADSSRNQSIEDFLKTKIKLLIHIFVNITSIESQSEIIDALHNSFMTILYNLLNYPGKTSLKLQDIFWDKIISPVFANFYFKKDTSSAYLHRLGLSILDRLIRPTGPANDKAFSSIRCLSNESVQLSEIHSVNPRWIFSRFDKVMQILSLVFKSAQLDSESKINIMNKFMNTLKLFTRKEVQVSDVTRDIIDSMPVTLESLSKNSRISYDSLFKLIVNLNDTFGSQNLMIDSDLEAMSCYEALLVHSIQNYTSQQLNGIITMIQGAVGDKHYLQFVYQLVRLNNKHNRGDLESHICECLNAKKINRLGQSEMIIAGKIFRNIKSDFAAIAKRVIQHIVLLKADDFEKMVKLLGISEWSIPIFKFFLSLMHDAPYDHLKRTSLSLLRQRWSNDDAFQDLVSFLFENKFESEIKGCFEEIVQRVAKLAEPAKAKVGSLVSDFLLQLTEDDSVIDSMLEMAYMNGLNYSSLFKENLNKYPKIQALSVKKDSTQSSQEKASFEEISQQQIELETLIDRELRSPHKKFGSVYENQSSSEPDKSDSETRETTTRETKDANSKQTKQLTKAASDQESSPKSQPAVSSDSPNTSNEHSESLPRRRTRRQAAKEREELCSQKVLEISSEEPTSEKEAKAKVSQLADSKRQVTESNADAEEVQEAERDECSIDSHNDSESIEDSGLSIKSDSDQDRSKRSSEEDSFPNKRSKNEKQVSDSEESSKGKRVSDKAEGDVEMVDSSLSSHERKADDSMLSNSSEKHISDSFLNSSMIQANPTGFNTAEIPQNDKIGENPSSKRELVLPTRGLHVVPETTEPGRFVSEMTNYMNTIAENGFSQISPEERYALETSMLEFILKMRKA